MLVSDEGNVVIESGIPWQNGPVPLEYAITGLGPIHIRIAQFDYFKEVLEKVLLMREIAEENALHLFEVGEGGRSEEHTSELQSRGHLVCRLLLEKKKRQIQINSMKKSKITYE